MVLLGQDSKGNYKARKRLPDDVRRSTASVWVRDEAKFSAPATTKKHEAAQQFREWLNEVEGRISVIRGARDGTGVSLTSVGRGSSQGSGTIGSRPPHGRRTPLHVEHWRDTLNDAINSCGLSERDTKHFDALGASGRTCETPFGPVLADVGETAQFLAMKQLVLTKDTRNLFLIGYMTILPPR